MTDPMRSYDEFRRSIRNFAWLQDVVPGATDIDFLIERNGQFLLVEAKPWTKGVLMPYGQHKCLFRMSQMPGFRVYLAGEDADNVHLTLYNGARPPVITRRSGKPQAFWPPDRFMPVGKEGLRAIVTAWWQDASEVDA